MVVMMMMISKLLKIEYQNNTIYFLLVICALGSLSSSNAMKLLYMTEALALFILNLNTYYKKKLAVIFYYKEIKHFICNNNIYQNITELLSFKFVTKNDISKYLGAIKKLALLVVTILVLHY